MKISVFPNRFKEHAESAPGHTLKDTGLLLCGHQIGNKKTNPIKGRGKMFKKVLLVFVLAAALLAFAGL